MFIVAALCCSANISAKADIIEVTFTGVLTGTQPGVWGGSAQHSYSELTGRSFTASETFDTTKGTLTSPTPGTNELRDGLVWPATLTIDGLPTFRYWSGTNVIDWKTDYSFATSAIAGGFYDLYLGYDAPGAGVYQTGPCPGYPCGALRIDDIDVGGAYSVRGPVAGAGMPGLLLACGWLVAWRRRSRSGGVVGTHQ